MANYSRSATFKNLSVAFSCQAIERCLRDRPLLETNAGKINPGGNTVYEAEPYLFRGTVWSEGFDNRGYRGRAVRARDEQGRSHTCWNDYWVYDLSSSGLASSKVDAESCKPGQGAYCFDSELTVDLILGELEKMDIEFSLGSFESARRLFGLRVPNMGRPQIL
ncbi:MAG: hypothetical protein HYS53_02590 [Candidatus Aenigmarchaeota archaeon]|nr:hypothetical protein [Candidatus Aenigmarchaeota archaeon]